MMVKTCCRCKQEKELSNFYSYQDKRRKNKYPTSYCKSCHKDFYIVNRERFRKWIWKGHLRRKYGLSLEDYESLKAKQNNCCLICNEEKALNVDHNHLTGKVRGLLCRGCNTAIGLLKEDVSLLNKAIFYLKDNE